MGLLFFIGMLFITCNLHVKQTSWKKGKDSEKRRLTDEEGKQFDELRAKADSPDIEITRLEAVADDERSLPGLPAKDKTVTNDEQVNSLSQCNHL